MAETSCRIYLVAPTAFEPPGFRPLLEQALGAGDIACLLFWPAGGGDEERRAAGEMLARELLLDGARQRGVPLLEALAGPPLPDGADGVHVEAGIAALKAAMAAHAPRRMVGAGGLHTRHDAMEAAEAGVDYVMFGSASPAAGGNDFTLIHDLAAWWGPLFEVPCVAPAASLDEALALARAGVDFVAVRDYVWHHEAGPAAAVASLDAALAGVATQP